MKIKAIPLFLILLPIYFLIFNGTGFSFQLSLNLIKTIFVYYTAIGLLFGLIYLLNKNVKTTAVISFDILFLFLFFGNIKDSFVNIPFLYSYKFLISLFILITIFNYLILRKNKNYVEPQFRFLNKLILVLFVVQIVLFIRSVPHYIELKKDTFATAYPQKQANIHLILLDAYPGFISLKQQFNYENNELKNFFRKNNCYVFDTIFSNYIQTYYSMNSLLNLQHIQYLNEKNIKRYSTVLQQLKEINENQFLKLLIQNGYTFYNNSIFEIENMQPLNAQLKFTPYEDLINRNTFYNRLMKDNLWKFTQDRFKINSVYDKIVLGQFHQIKNQIAYAKQYKSNAPYFVYTHLLMPHEPYFTDSLGTLKLNKDRNIETEKRQFLDYLKYTNLELKETFNQIKSSDSNALIIIMSDHGYRDFNTPSEIKLSFNNLLVVYSKDIDTVHLKKIHTNVNLFRVIANDFLKQNLPLIPDTLFYINEEKGSINKIQL